MILVLCNDDPNLWAAAQGQAGPVFGQAYLFISNATPALGQHENLFILAHGMPGEIGNANGLLGYNALDVWNYLNNTTPNGRGASIFPPNYAGNVFVWACYPGNITRQDRLSFIENLHALLRPWLRNTNVYGVLGAVPYTIPDPGNTAWIQVANT